MDATLFIPREYHAAMAEIGRTDWVGFESMPDVTGDKTLFRSVARLSGAVSKFSPEAKRLFSTFNEMGNLHILDACAAFIATGPKFFRPDADQCAAMANVEVRIQFGDFRMPFPALAVVFPTAYAREHRLPPAVLCHWRPDGIAIIGGNPFNGNGKSHTFNACFAGSGNPNPLEHLFEEVVYDSRPELPQDWDCVAAYRIAVNCCLALTQYETRLRDLNDTANLRRLAGAANPQKRDRARRLLLGEPKVIEFTQDVLFHDTAGAAPGGGGAGEPTGRAVSTHWRRGHWRRQAYGPRTADARHKLVFIKPVLVRADRFAGTPAETMAIYRAPGA